MEVTKEQTCTWAQVSRSLPRALPTCLGGEASAQPWKGGTADHEVSSPLESGSCWAGRDLKPTPGRRR